MKKFLVLAFGVVAIQSFAIDLSGKYSCNGYDTNDGSYGPETVTLVKTAHRSYPEKDLYSYSFQLADEKGVVQYTGYAASNADSLSIFFENVNKKDAKTRNDYGVGAAVVSRKLERDKQGKFTENVSFSKFYFEPKYVSDGSEICKKIS